MTKMTHIEISQCLEQMVLLNTGCMAKRCERKTVDCLGFRDGLGDGHSIETIQCDDIERYHPDMDVELSPLQGLSRCRYGLWLDLGMVD